VKVLQIMAGAKYGGAEEFFTRLTVALHKTDIEQQVVIRKNDTRAKRLIDSGVEPTQMKFGGKLDFRTPWELKRRINDFKPDIVFSWMNRATSMCPTKKNFIHIGRLGGYYNLKYYSNCDHLIANTEDIADYIKNNGWEENKVHCLPNFVGATQAKPIDRKQFFTPQSATLILGMGRFHKNKGFDVLLDAVSRVPNTYLWLVGEGPLRGELEAQAERIGIKPRTRFLGWWDDPEELFAAADLFVCPSRHEPLGNVVIEAWAQGVPVIAADSIGPGMLIDQGINGVLFPVDDERALANSINRLIREPILAEEIVVQARHDYADNYTEGIVIDKYLKFFERVVD
jgi:glycosyltransferase involved in cell wall biosynthesis